MSDGIETVTDSVPCVAPVSQIKAEPLEENATNIAYEVESTPTPWEFLTTPPDKDALLKPRNDSPEGLFLSPVKEEDSEVAQTSDEDKVIDTEAKTFIEALDHLAGHKSEQDNYFYDQNRYGDQLLFAENALLDVASEETVTPEGNVTIYLNSN